MKLISLLLILHLAHDREHVADKQYFSVWRGDDKVGTLTTWQRKEGSRTAYYLCSNVEFNLLWSVKVNEQITEIFENGNLQTSSHLRHVNDDLRVSNQVVTCANGYQISNIHNEITRLVEAIPFSVLSLYFHEPLDQQRAYSQSHRQFVTLRETKQHVFRIDLPNGAVTTYSYHDGLLQQVESKSYVGTIRFVRDVNNELTKK